MRAQGGARRGGRNPGSGTIKNNTALPKAQATRSRASRKNARLVISGRKAAKPRSCVASPGGATHESPGWSPPRRAEPWVRSDQKQYRSAEGRRLPQQQPRGPHKADFALWGGSPRCSSFRHAQRSGLAILLHEREVFGSKKTENELRGLEAAKLRS